MFEIDMIHLRDTINEYYADCENPDIIYEANYNELIGEPGFWTESLRTTSKKSVKSTKKVEPASEHDIAPPPKAKSRNQSIDEIRERILNMAKQCDKDIDECIDLIDTFKFDKDPAYVIKNACNMLSDCRNMATSMDKFINKGKCRIAQQAMVNANMTLYGLLIAIANRARYYIYYAYDQTQVFPDIVSAFYRLTRYINRIERRRDELSLFEIDRVIIEELKMPNIKIVEKLRCIK